MPDLILVSHPRPVYRLKSCMGLLPSQQGTPADNPKHNQDTILMNQSQGIYTNFIGFDVSKHTIAVHNHTAGTTEDIKNSPSDLRRFARSLPQTCLAICQPTGGYEASLLTALTAAQVPGYSE